jgi:hypothetical protein
MAHHVIALHPDGDLSIGIARVGAIADISDGWERFGRNFFAVRQCKRVFSHVPQ